MIQCRRISTLAALCLLWVSAVSSAQTTAPPPRIVLLVDSSQAVSGMLNQFRAGLTAFVDALPENAEVAFISTGGQIRIRVPPTADREKLRKAASGFSPDGGANSMLDTLLESDKRFLKTAPDRRPVFVVLTTDAADNREPPLDEYNKFMNDFLQRRGRAHGIVVRGRNTGLVGEIVINLTKNTGGVSETISIPTGLPDKMKAIAARIAAGQ